MTESLVTFKLNLLPNNIYYIPEFVSEAEEEKLVHQTYAAPKPKWTQLSNRRLQNWGGLPHPKGMVQEKLPDWLDVVCRKVSDLGIFGGKVANHVLINEYLPGQGIMPHSDGPLYHPAVCNLTLASHIVLDFYHPLSKDATQESTTTTQEFMVTTQESTATTRESTATTQETSATTQESTATTRETCDKCAEKGDINDSHEPPSVALSERHLGSLLLQRRSLVVVTDDAYTCHMHGIKELNSDVVTNKIVNLHRCPGIEVGDTLDRSTRVSLTIRVVPKVLKTRLFFGKR